MGVVAAVVLVVGRDQIIYAFLNVEAASSGGDDDDGSSEVDDDSDTADDDGAEGLEREAVKLLRSCWLLFSIMQMANSLV